MNIAIEYSIILLKEKTALTKLRNLRYENKYVIFSYCYYCCSCCLSKHFY